MRLVTHCVVGWRRKRQPHRRPEWIKFSPYKDEESGECNDRRNDIDAFKDGRRTKSQNHRSLWRRGNERTKVCSETLHKGQEVGRILGAVWVSCPGRIGILLLCAVFDSRRRATT